MLDLGRSSKSNRPGIIRLKSQEPLQFLPFLIAFAIYENDAQPIALTIRHSLLNKASRWYQLDADEYT